MLEGYKQGDPDGNQHVADGPSEGMHGGEYNREWVELSVFGFDVKHLVQGWRMFCLSSYCLEQFRFSCAAPVHMATG